MFIIKFVVCKVMNSVQHGTGHHYHRKIKSFDKLLTASDFLTKALVEYDGLQNKLDDVQKKYPKDSSVYEELIEAEDAMEDFYNRFGFKPDADDEFCIIQTYVFQRNFSTTSKQ